VKGEVVKALETQAGFGSGLLEQMSHAHPQPGSANDGSVQRYSQLQQTQMYLSSHCGMTWIMQVLLLSSRCRQQRPASVLSAQGSLLDSLLSCYYHASCVAEQDNSGNSEQ